MGNLTITGDRSLIQKLKSIGDPKRIRSITRRSMSVAGRFLRESFFSEAPEATGATKKALSVIRTRTGSGQDGVIVGVKQGAKFTVSPKKRGGTKLSRVKKNENTVMSIVKTPSVYAGIVERKSPWFIPAWTSNRNRAAGMVITSLRNEITNPKG